MKKFNKFINEINSINNFIFAVNIKNATDEQLEELEKKVKNKFNSTRPELNIVDEVNYRKGVYMKTRVIIFNMYDKISRTQDVAISYITNPGFGKGMKHMEDIMNIDEFLKVGFDEVEKYIKIKNNIEKYNL